MTTRAELEPEREPALLVCIPQRFGTPAEPSHIARCERCGATVYVAARADWRGRIICLICGMALLKPGDTIAPAPWVFADLEDADDD